MDNLEKLLEEAGSFEIRNIKVQDFKRPVCFLEYQKDYFQQKSRKIALQFNQKQDSQIEIHAGFTDEILWEDYLNAVPKPPLFLLLKLPPLKGFCVFDASHLADTPEYKEILRINLKLFLHTFEEIWKELIHKEIGIEKTTRQIEESGIPKHETVLLCHFIFMNKINGEEVPFNLCIPYLSLKPYLSFIKER